MKSKKALTLVLLIVTSMLLLPLYVPISPVSADPGSGLPLDPNYIHLELYIPPEYGVTYAPKAPEVGDLWMTVHPMEETGNKYNLTYLVDENANDEADPSEQIILRNLADGSSKWYHVEYVTVTLKVENTTVDTFPNVFYPYPLYLEFNGTLLEFLMQQAMVGDPRGTVWHMIYPKWSLLFNLTSWIDEGSGNLTYCDMIDLTTYPDPNTIPGFNTIYWHVDSVKTDIIVSEVEEYPEDTELIHLDLESAPKTVRNVTVGDEFHEIYPDFCKSYSLTYLVDEDGDNNVSICEQIALFDLDQEPDTPQEVRPAKWYHVEWITATIKVNNTGTIWYLEFGGTIEKYLEIESEPRNTFWHRVEPGFSSWFTIISWTDDTDGVLSVGDTIDFIETGGDWEVLELKTNLIVSEEPFYPDSPGLMHLDIEGPLDYPVEPYVSSIWIEDYPNADLYHLFSHVDTNNNSRIDHCDYIKLENITKAAIGTGEKKWYHVECVTATIHVHNNVTMEPLILEFGTNTTLDKFWKIWEDPVGTWWHEIWPVFSWWHEIAAISGSGFIEICNNITFSDIEGYWHIDIVKTNLVVSPKKPPTYFWVSPKTNIAGAVGSKFTVDIMVEDALETQAWEFTLNFDNDTLGVTNVVEGGWISAQGPNYTCSHNMDEANDTGTITVGCALGLPFIHGAALDGKLASITFYVKAEGTSPLDLQNTKLVDMSWTTSEYPNKDGFFCSNGYLPSLHDVAITKIEVSPHQLQQDEYVYINVTIHNEGSVFQTVNLIVYADLECHVWNWTDPDELARGDEIIILDTVVPDLEPCVPVTIEGIIWDTTPVAGEQYTIWAEVIKIDGFEDDDPSDNVFVDGNVHVRSHHDLKIWDVAVSKSQVDAVSDHKGDDPATLAEEKEQRTTEITVTVLNEGKVPENCTVTVTLTSDDDNATLGPKTVQNLAASHSIVVGFEWDANGVTPGNYTVSANVTLTTLGAIELEKNLADNVMEDGTVNVVIRDIAILDVTVLHGTAHSEGYNPITRMEITAKNVGSVYMKFAVLIFADPMNLTSAAPPLYKKPSFPIVDGDEVLCGTISTGLAPGDNYTYTGMALPDGTPGWNRTGSPLLSSIMRGESWPRYAVGTPVKFPYGWYYIVAIVKEDIRYPDKNYANDYSTTAYEVAPVDHDIAVTDVQRLSRFVYPGTDFDVEVTVANQGRNAEDVNITVYADEDTTLWNGNETLVGYDDTVSSLAAGSSVTKTITCSSDNLITGKWYTIFANVTILSPPDEDPNDNIRYDSTIKITTYDINITSIATNWDTYHASCPCTLLETAYPSWCTIALEITTTIYNNDSASHSFHVYLWIVNASDPDDKTLISTQFLKNVDPYSYTSAAKVKYYVPCAIACAYPYPVWDIVAIIDVEDAVPGNNEASFSSIHMKWTGDANGDGIIDVSDLTILAGSWFNQPAYNPAADFSLDSLIDLSDLTLLAANWFEGPNQNPGCHD